MSVHLRFTQADFKEEKNGKKSKNRTKCRCYFLFISELTCRFVVGAFGVKRKWPLRWFDSLSVSLSVCCLFNNQLSFLVRPTTYYMCIISVCRLHFLCTLFLTYSKQGTLYYYTNKELYSILQQISSIRAPPT